MDKDLGRDAYAFAIDDEIYEELFEDSIGQLLLDNERLRLMVFSPETEEIQRWHP